jgi:organic radical activating enzyme
MLALAHANGPDFMFVFTGGEPLMQQDSIELLLGSYRARNFKRANAWIETNGTYTPSKTIVQRYHANFVTSPKVGFVKTDALKALSELGAHFKFVIDDKDSWSFDEALTLAKTLGVTNDRIWMQPMAQERKNMIKRSQDLWAKCAATGVNLSVRAHIWVHGKKLGV